MQRVTAYKNTQQQLAKYRKVNAKRGQRVRYCGKLGVITDLRGGDVYIRLEGERHSQPVHPTWKMEYLDSRKCNHLNCVATELTIFKAAYTFENGVRVLSQPFEIGGVQSVHVQCADCGLDRTYWGKLPKWVFALIGDTDIRYR